MLKKTRTKSEQTGSEFGKLRLFLTGFGMGSADIVPGVSGGTIAFIFGIYEELVVSIKKISGDVPRLLLGGKFKDALASIPFAFLVPLFLGIFAAIASLSRVLSHLLVTQPALVWSFFFGLVLASILIIRKRILAWNPYQLILLLISTIISYFVVGMVPVETAETSLAFFLSGAIAIVAMILPGISGSFILVLMGKYTQVLSAVVNFDVFILGTVMLGAVVGISVFSRLLSWLFRSYHDMTVVVLIGLMIGSLRKIWPWKEVVETTLDRHGALIPIREKNILPDGLDTSTFFALFLFFSAFAFMIYMDKKIGGDIVYRDENGRNNK